MEYYVIVCTPAGRYSYLNSFRDWAMAKSHAIYYAHRGGTIYLTNSAPLAVQFMASTSPTTFEKFEAMVREARRHGSKVARFLPLSKDGCPWCNYADKPKRNNYSIECRCLCPRCGEASHMDAWYMKHRGTDGGHTWFTEK